LEFRDFTFPALLANEDIPTKPLFIQVNNMNTGLYCIWCGGRLDKEGENTACIECGTEFSDMLVSETSFESSEATFVELSVSMECIKAKRRDASEIYPAPEETPVAVECL
jgi:hypothetical protein